MPPDPTKRGSLPDQGARRPDHWTAVENFASHARGVFKPGEYRAKHLKHEPGVYEMTDLVPAAERDRLWAENKALKANRCPDGEVCKTCPCASEDDVCFPGERLRAEVEALRAERHRLRALLKQAHDRDKFQGECPTIAWYDEVARYFEGKVPNDPALARASDEVTR